MLRKSHQEFMAFVAALLAVPVAASWGQSLGHEAPRFNGASIVSSRPLVDVADVLEARYRKPVAYEDPVWESSGDFEVQNIEPRGLLTFVPVRHILALPPGLTPEQTPFLDASLVRRVLDEYHLQIDGPHFRTISSKYGLHIVPEFVRDASGHLVPAKNPLDAPITIPTANRAVSAHFAAICAAVTKATGLDVGCSAPGGGEDWYTKLFAAPGGVLEWGTNQISARDALADLLDNSSTTFSWRFLCQPNSAFGGRRCVLNLRPIYVAAPGGDGDMTVVRLEYDRRGPPAPTVIEPVP